jgi:ribosomal protein S18 acetylase RimI-like enzyme
MSGMRAPPNGRRAETSGLRDDPPMRIREFRTPDGDALRDLWAGAGFRLTGDDDPGLARFADRNPGLLLVAEDDGLVVGSAMGAWDGHRGWIYHVAVTPDRRRSGLASELVARVEDGLRAVGCPRVLVMVEGDNDGGLAFWVARGYERRGTIQLGKAL